MYSITGFPPEERSRLTLIFLSGDGTSDKFISGLSGLPSLHITNSGDALGAAEAPGLRKIILQQPTNRGEEVNIGIREAQSDYALVLNPGMRVKGTSFRPDSRILSRLPVLRGDGGEPLPCASYPLSQRGRFAYKIPQNGTPALFPNDYSGFYNTERFLSLGGYDPEIISPLWQRVEFGVRGWLFGEELRFADDLLLEEGTPAPPADLSHNHDYVKVWFRCWGVRLTDKGARLPLTALRRFPTLRGVKEFARSGRWIIKNSERYRCDFAGLLREWDSCAEP